MAKKTKRRKKRITSTKANVAELKKYSKEKLPVAKISKAMKRTARALRQKAGNLGIRLGHRR
jgi:lipoate-protein ligase A